MTIVDVEWKYKNKNVNQFRLRHEWRQMNGGTCFTTQKIMIIDKVNVDKLWWSLMLPKLNEAMQRKSDAVWVQRASKETLIASAHSSSS